MTCWGVRIYSPYGEWVCGGTILYYYHDMWKQHNHWNFSLSCDQMMGESEYLAEVVFQIHTYVCLVCNGAFPFIHLLLLHSYSLWYRWTGKQRGRNDPVFPPRQPVTGGQPALLDWTGAGILGVAAQHWPFTELPFSSARVKRSAGAGEQREGGCGRTRDRK